MLNDRDDEKMAKSNKIDEDDISENWWRWRIKLIKIRLPEYDTNKMKKESFNELLSKSSRKVVFIL